MALHCVWKWSTFCLDFQLILVVGGSESSLVEVVSLDPETNPVPNCLSDLNPFPTTVYRAAGAVLGSGQSNCLFDWDCFNQKSIFNVICVYMHLGWVAGGKEGKTWDVCWPGLVPFVTLVWKPPKIDKTSNSVKNAIKRFQIALWASYWVF
jgi:hypothetical protein